ncbi:MAG TPA: peptidylprolyl isomerase [Candidatus Binatia bacterium]|jgi:peptidyl-prolyl cis-trans isomerase C|nr:peptidylprolyl isomerase [Candidatus Binatia bacterium]
MTGAALLAALAVGCGGRAEQAASSESAAPAPTGEVIATYAGHTLDSTRVAQELGRLPAASRTYLAAPERKRQFVEQMVLTDLLYEEGRKAGYDTDQQIERQVNELRKRLVVQRVMRDYQTTPEIGDDQVRAYYDQNPVLYSSTQIHASHILVKDEATAREIAADLQAHPERFADVARAKSIDTTTGPKGGDLGTFGPGRMTPDFERVAFALEPGQVSQPVKTQFGWHVITVTERKEGERKPFDQVKEQIRGTLRNKAIQERLQAYYDQLKRDADVKIDDGALARLDVAGTGDGKPAAPMPFHH